MLRTFDHKVGFNVVYWCNKGRAARACSLTRLLKFQIGEHLINCLKPPPGSTPPFFVWFSSSSWFYCPSNPCRPSLVERSQVVRILRLSDHPIHLLLHSIAFGGIRIATFQLHADATPNRHGISVSLLLFVVTWAWKEFLRRFLDESNQ